MNPINIHRIIQIFANRHDDMPDDERDIMILMRKLICKYEGHLCSSGFCSFCGAII